MVTAVPFEIHFTEVALNDALMHLLPVSLILKYLPLSSQASLP